MRREMPSARWHRLTRAIDSIRPERETAMTPMQCEHVSQVRDVTPRTPEGCEECLKAGGRWVHLRLCLSCGHVGCCDSSPGRHATKHFHATDHPVVPSL